MRARRRNCAPRAWKLSGSNSIRSWAGHGSSDGSQPLLKAKGKCARVGRGCAGPTVAKKAKVALPVAPLPDLMKWWRFQKTRGLVIGGLAVALLGRPRVTRDVDALILLAENLWPAFVEAGSKFGFFPRQSDTLAYRHRRGRGSRQPAV